MTDPTPTETFKTVTCIEIRCNVCGYALDEEEDGVIHFDTRAEAVRTAEHHDWAATAETIVDGDKTYDGYAICYPAGGDAAHDAALHWLAAKVPGLVAAEDVPAAATPTRLTEEQP